MKSIIASSVLAVAASAATFNDDVQFTAAPGSEDNTVMFTLMYPTTYGWVGVGYGNAPNMPNNRFWITYHDGSSVTVSEREASSQTMPTDVDPQNITIDTSGSTVADDMVTAMWTVPISEDAGTANLPTSGTAQFVWGVHSDQPETLDVDATLPRHDNRGAVEVTIGEDGDGGDGTDDADGSSAGRFLAGLAGVMATMFGSLLA